MLGLTRYLRHHGLSLDDVRGFLRPLRDNESLLLVGSVAEGLAYTGSDLDLLLLAAGPGPLLQSRNSLLQSLPEGFDLNLEILTPADIAVLGQRFSRVLDEMRIMETPQRPIQSIRFVGPEDLRLLHRIYAGVPLSARDGDIDELRQRLMLHRLGDVCVLQQAACHIRLRADAENALREGETATAILMAQIAAQHLLGCALASIGETNMTTKWMLRLARDHASELNHIEFNAIGDVILNTTALTASALVARLHDLSRQTLAAVIAASVKSASPITAALHDLIVARSELCLGAA